MRLAAMRGALSLAMSATCACGATARSTSLPITNAETTATARASWVVEDDPLAIAADVPAEHLASRELVPQWGHAAGVRELRWLPSGPLAVLDDLGHLALLEPSSGERMLWERPAPPGPWEEPFEVDRSGRYLRIGRHVHDLRSGDERLLPFDLGDGAIAAAAPDLSAFAWSIRGDDDVTRLFVAEADGTNRFTDTIDLERIALLAWSPTAQSLVIGSARVLELVRATDGTRLLRVEAAAEESEGGVVAAFRPTGGALAMVVDGDLSIVDPRTGTELGRIASVAPAGSWSELRWSADGGRLAVARRDDEDAIVLVFDAHDGSRVGEIRVPFGLPSEAALSPDARLLAVGTSDGRVHVHEAEGGAEILLVDSGHGATSPPFTFDPRARFLAVAGSESIELWDLELREEIGGFYQPGAERHLHAMRGLGGSVGVLTADEDASYLWTPDTFRMDDGCPHGGAVRVDDEGTVRVVGRLAICDLTHGITVQPGWWIRSSSRDGHVVLNANGGLFVEDALTGERRATLALDDGERPPCSTSMCGLPAAISDDGARVAVARRNLLRLFDGRSGAELGRTDVAMRTSAMELGPSGRSLAFVGQEGLLVVFDLPAFARRFERTSTRGFAAAFSPDGRLHVHATAGAVGVVSLRGRASPIDVPLETEIGPTEIVFLGDGARFALERTRRPGEEGRRAVLEIRTSRDASLVSATEADAVAISSDGSVIAICRDGLLGALDGTSAESMTRSVTALGACTGSPLLALTDDGRFVYVSDDEGLRVVRVSDHAHVSLHLVDAGWGVTAPVVRDDASRWDDGGYFDAPFLLRGDGEITSASLDDARSSFVAGLAGYFARGEEPPMDEAAQPDAE